MSRSIWAVSIQPSTATGRTTFCSDRILFGRCSRMRRSLVPRPWMYAIPLVLAAAVYARFFAGFWLGDDFGFLHQMWLAAANHDLWEQTWTQFVRVDPTVVFYRPMMVASVALNEWIGGNDFAVWFGFNYLLHMGNTAMVALLSARLAAACGRDGRIAAIVVAAFFGLCPTLAEGVFWVAARADACVTLLTLVGVYAWAASPILTMRAAILPLLLVVALGFKESAAVFPLQMALVALAWPTRPSRAQIVAVVASLVLVVFFFVVRAHFFGSFLRVYTRPDTLPHFDELWLGIRSIGDWWKGLTWNRPRGATAYVGLLGSACVFVAAGTRGPQGRLAAALFCAFAGLVIATLLSVNGMVASGEGGRLTYTPMAWLALAIGVAGAKPMVESGPKEIHQKYARAGLALLLCATIAGAWVLQGELRTARSAQNLVRNIVNGSREWAVAHPGLTLLIIEETYGPVVTTRNAQGWLVLPPVQPAPLLHRVLPTPSAELDARHDQLSAGLATRLDKIRPSRLGADELSRLFAHDTAHWPDHYACWSARAQRIVEITSPDPSDRTRWTAALRNAIGQCATANL